MAYLRIPTHQCKICGALWILYPAQDGESAFWSLCSLHCSQCCDNAGMGDQIIELDHKLVDQMMENSITLDVL